MKDGCRPGRIRSQDKRLRAGHRGGGHLLVRDRQVEPTVREARFLAPLPDAEPLTKSIEIDADPADLIGCQPFTEHGLEPVVAQFR